MSQETDIAEQFTTAYEKHAEALVHFCMRQGSSPQDAEEFVQEAFMRTWEYLKAGREIASIKAFLYQVVNNVIIDEARRRKKSREVSLDALQEQGFDPGHDDTERLQVRLEAKAILRRVDTEKEYRLLFMRYVQGFPLDHIATVFGVTPNAVAVKLHRAVKRLSHKPFHRFPQLEQA